MRTKKQKASNSEKADTLETLCVKLLHHIGGNFSRTIGIESVLGARGVGYLNKIAEECQRRSDARESLNN